MAFLAPLILVGLAALAVPVIIHMVYREQKDVVEFPSLMFIRKIPFRSYRRQRIRHWLLLLLRCAALALLVTAFARPFFRVAALGAVTSGAREVVMLMDRSYSMAYGDRWDRAKTAADDVIAGLAPDDRATLIFFDSGAESGPRSMIDRASLSGLVSGAELGAGTTSFGPALKLAERIFEESRLPRLEAVLISDFQRSGVESAAGVRFPEGTVLTPVPIGDERTANVSVAGVSFEREYFSGRERVAVSARVTNRGAEPVDGVEVTLEVAGREAESLRTDLPASGSSTVDFQPVTFETAAMIGAVRIAPDQLPTDDVFYFTAAPGQVVTVLLVGNDRGGRDAGLYFRRALGIGSSPAFEVVQTTVGAFNASDLSGSKVVVLNDAPPPSGQAGLALERFVEDGGGLLVVSGERSTWPEDRLEILPGTIGSPVDRVGRGGSLGFVDYSHPVFELFGTARSGDVTTARFFRYRPVDVNGMATVLARYDDGSAALTERRVGEGTVLLWASTLDNFWNDLALKPVYLPFVHRLTEHLADYTPPTPWFRAGQVLNLAERRTLLAEAGLEDAELVAISPSGQRIPVTEAERAGFITVAEQGYYEIHDASTTEGRPLTLAVNIDLAEADLDTVDPSELASSVTGRVAQERTDVAESSREIGPEDVERRQRAWWYLLVAAALFFVAETVVSNRLSRQPSEVD